MTAAGVIGWLAVAAAAGAARAVAPALKVEAALGGLDYAARALEPRLLAKLRAAKLPAFSDNAGTPIGHVKIDVTRCAVRAAAIKTIGAAAPGGVLRVSLSGIDLAFGCDWSYRKDHWPHIKDHGTADISFGGAAVEADFGLGVVRGKGIVHAGQCRVSVGSFGMKLHGGASWLYNFLEKLFRHKIEAAIESALDRALCADIAKALDTALANLPTQVPVDAAIDLGLDYALDGAPVIDASRGIVLSSVGQFYDMALPATRDTRCRPGPMALPATKRMLQFVIDQCALDSLAVALQNAGQLQALITEKNLPPNYRGLNLTTNWFEFLIPELTQQFPNRTMQVDLHTTSAPLVAIVGSAVQVSAVIHANVSVQNPVVPVFTLEAAVALNASVALNATAVVPRLGWVKGSTKLLWSRVGSSWAAFVNPLLTDALEYVALPIASALLAGGIRLPAPNGIALKNPSIQWGQESLLVGSDFVFS